VQFASHTIVGGADGALSVYAIDVDGVTVRPFAKYITKDRISELITVTFEKAVKMAYI